MKKIIFTRKPTKYNSFKDHILDNKTNDENNVIGLCNITYDKSDVLILKPSEILIDLCQTCNKLFNKK